MIPPNLLNITYYFSLLPVYEQEPAADSAGESSPDTNAPASAPSGDADNVNDQVALRMVFKGYKLTAIPQWEAQANSGYERWVEGRGDDDAERQRQDQRARGATRPNPHAASTPGLPATEASPPAESAE